MIFSLILFLPLATAHQVYVCNPETRTEALLCKHGEWVRVQSEVYAPRNTNQATCGYKPTNCNKVLFQNGLETNCNGPVPASQPCREIVDIEKAKKEKECLSVMDVSAAVQYECIDGKLVIDVCDDVNKTLITTGSFVKTYFVSPNFGNSQGVGRECKCVIKGSNVQISAVDVSLVKDVPGLEGESVVTINTASKQLWISKDSCTDCSMVKLKNTYMFDEHNEETEIVLTYSDFGLANQNMWFDIKEFSNSRQLDISCSSEALPASRLVTTTTTATTKTTTPTTTTTTTTTPTTTTTTTTLPTTLTTTTVDTTDRPNTTTQENTETETDKKQHNTASAEKTHSTVSTSDTTSQDFQASSTAKSDSSNVEVTVIVLVSLIVGLLIVGAVLIILIYRKRHKYDSEEYKGFRGLCMDIYFNTCYRHKPPKYLDESNYTQQTNNDDIKEKKFTEKDTKDKDLYKEPVHQNQVFLLSSELSDSHQKMIAESMTQLKLEKSLTLPKKSLTHKGKLGARSNHRKTLNNSGNTKQAKYNHKIEKDRSDKMSYC